MAHEAKPFISFSVLVGGRIIPLPFPDEESPRVQEWQFLNTSDSVIGVYETEGCSNIIVWNEVNGIYFRDANVGVSKRPKPKEH